MSNGSKSASINFSIDIPKEVIKEYFDGVARVEKAKSQQSNGSLISVNVDANGLLSPLLNNPTPSDETDQTELFDVVKNVVPKLFGDGELNEVFFDFINKSYNKKQCEDSKSTPEPQTSKSDSTPNPILSFFGEEGIKDMLNGLGVDQKDTKTAEMSLISLLKSLCEQSKGSNEDKTEKSGETEKTEKSGETEKPEKTEKSGNPERRKKVVETKPELTVLPEKAKSEEAKSEDVKLEEAKSKETKLEEVKSEDVKDQAGEKKAESTDKNELPKPHMNPMSIFGNPEQLQDIMKNIAPMVQTLMGGKPMPSNSEEATGESNGEHKRPRPIYKSDDNVMHFDINSLQDKMMSGNPAEFMSALMGSMMAGKTPTPPIPMEDTEIVD